MTEKDLKGGVLCLYKPEGVTSHDMVYKVRKLFGTRQVGHTGTLDPLATGVLVVMVGRAVKASEFLSSDEKEYLATVRLGLTTDTEDISGKTLTVFDGQTPCFDEIKNAALNFSGDIMQTPPMYSALKIGGKKLLDLARKGIEVEREARAVRVDTLEVFETAEPSEFKLLTRVSKGTYIRTLCADIGALLGCGAVMATLTRLSCGSFGLEDCVTLSELEAMSEAERLARLCPVETLFPECPDVNLSDFFAHLAHSGCELYQRKLSTSFPLGTLVKLYDENGFFALARATDFPDGSALKPVKQFRI